MSYREIEVSYNDGEETCHVGTVAASGLTTVFEYDPAWMKRGIELSPFHLPVAEQRHQSEPRRLIAGTFGLFADSLPDGWGTLIMDRWFAKKGFDKQAITPLDRLAFLGSSAMGALCYHPPLTREPAAPVEAVDVGEMAREAYALYQGRIEDAGRLLAQIGGSPGGARPKALIGISGDFSSFISGGGDLPEGFEHWLVKFSGGQNSFESVLEYTYNQLAENAGITVPESRLIADDKGRRHIAVRRFDRPGNNRRCHIATVGGLLHADHMAPSLDYATLLQVAWKLTGSAAQVEEQFRRAVFNLFAVNRDDHAKNHGYVMTGDGHWGLSPAYDLTFSTGPGGEHWTSYNGEGRNPRPADLLAVAEAGSINGKTALAIIDRMQSVVAGFRQMARENGVPDKVSAPIARRIEAMMP